MRGEEAKVKLLLHPTRVVTDYRDVLDALFKISKKSMDLALTDVADKIIRKIAVRGEEGLFAKDWESYYKELNISQAQYFYVLRTLKQANIIYKSKGKFYLSTKFGDHLADLAGSFSKYFMRLGVKRDEKL